MPIYTREQWETELIACYESCLRYARRLVGSNVGAEDLLHDVLAPMAARVNRGAFNIDAPLAGYITSSLKKRVYTRWKAKIRKVELVSVQILIECCDQDIRNDVFDPGLIDLMKLIGDVAGTRQMTTLVMHDLLGYTYKEISQMTSIGSASTVHGYHASALQAMQTYYSGTHPASGPVAVARQGVAASASTAPSGEETMSPDSEES